MKVSNSQVFFILLFRIKGPLQNTTFGNVLLALRKEILLILKSKNKVFFFNDFFIIKVPVRKSILDNTLIAQWTLTLKKIGIIFF